jgi:pimeloyl-ACP methyl ester carboxylesterase
MGDDILAVADACGVERFAIWGVSFGGNVSRYLAARSQRVSKLVLLGSPLGPGASGQRRTQALDFCAHWPPILQGLRDGMLDSGDLSPEDRDSLHRLNIPAMLGWVQAMLDWPVVGPTDLLCPTLWLVGSEDDHAMVSVREFEDSLPGSGVQLHVVQGLDHEQIFDEIETVLPIMVAFTKS